MAYYDIGVSTAGDYKKFVRGTASKTTADTTKVTLGFKPTFVMYYNLNASNAILATVIWDSARPDVQQYSYSNSINVAMPTGQVNLIASIDNDGFTVNKSGAATWATIEYIAIG